jgi:hypothetical protein
MACTSPPRLGFNDFVSVVTLSLSSTKSRETQTVVTPAWRHTGRRLGSWRRCSMVSSSTISSGETMRQPTPSPGSDRAMNHPLQVCSRKTYSRLPFDLRRIYLHPRQGSPRANIAWHQCRGPRRIKTARSRFMKPTWGPQPGQLDRPSPNVDWWRPISKYL